MSTTTGQHLDEFLALLDRLGANVASGMPDQADQPMKIPAAAYRDPDQWQREMDEIFLRVPLLVTLSCDIREPGEFVSLEIAGRPILVVRGDDGVARTFLNSCRHRGAKVTDLACGQARRFTCPYHFWSYDRAGALVGVTGKETFGEVDASALIELPTEEFAGTVFATLDPAGQIDLPAWLGDMARSLASLRLDGMHPYRKVTWLESPNWKLAADGYLDGYHIGYLHKDTIGTKAVTNRNTYDLMGPHVRIGFATKLTTSLPETPPEQWNFPDHMSLVNYIFPNVSISGGHGDTIQLSRLYPGPTVDRSMTAQHQYFRQPVEGDMIEAAETKRLLYERVVRDEDCATIFGISAALPGIGDGHLLFGRNEPGNQHLHQTIAAMTSAPGGR
jgi:phenylpropionate dioxygenase-like ring-hydroxylating dioxygenase large terminal subunit